MTVINTNLNSLITQAALSKNNRSLGQSMEQLATGKRINSAADDAAGLAISNRQTSQIRGLNQAVRNANDAISMLQTAEGATNEVTNMLQRMRELAVQSTNGTYAASDRTALQSEFAELQAEITRISNNTEWNASKIVDGTMTAVTFQVGANASQANTSITSIDTAMAAIDSFRSDMGAKINRFQHAGDNLTNVSTNTSAARSRILDADYAKTASEMARTQIIQQAATAVLAQANTSQQSVLKLLQ